MIRDLIAKAAFWLWLKTDKERKLIPRVTIQEFHESYHTWGYLKDSVNSLNDAVDARRYRYLTEQCLFNKPFIRAVREFNKALIVGASMNVAIEKAENEFNR